MPSYLFQKAGIFYYQRLVPMDLQSHYLRGAGDCTRGPFETHDREACTLICFQKCALKRQLLLPLSGIGSAGVDKTGSIIPTERGSVDTISCAYYNKPIRQYALYYSAHYSDPYYLNIDNMLY